MLLNRICRLVLCHDANDSMRYVGFFKVRDFVIRKLQLGSFYGAVYMMQLRCPDNRRGGLGKQPGKEDVLHGLQVMQERPLSIPPRSPWS